jgi:hypothetical protein
MIFRLDKMSSPGWDEPKDFLSETECAEELIKHICRGCREWNDEKKLDIPLRNLYDLLNTACGCEYYVEEIPDANDY